MKFTRLTACILAIAAATSAMPELAHGSSTFNLGVGFQYWDAKAADKFDEDGMGGVNVIARLQPAEFYGIDFRFGASGVWDSDTYHVDGQKYKTDATFTCYPVEAGLVLTLPLGDSITLYAGPGVGYYYYDIDIEKSHKHGHHYHSDKTKHIKVDDDFGWYALGGLSVRLATHLSLFGEVRYTDTETCLKDDDSVKFDCRGVGVQAGLMFDF